MRVRPEEPEDVDAVRELTREAFAPMRFSDGTEAEALDMLRRDGDLTLSLVAVEAGEIVGHVAFSPAKVGAEREGWFGIGPVSVRPRRQRSGIGSSLIRQGLEKIETAGARGCVLTGSELYYGRFGFVADGAVTYRDTPARNVMWLAFRGGPPEGEVRFSAGLEA